MSYYKSPKSKSRDDVDNPRINSNSNNFQESFIELLVNEKISKFQNQIQDILNDQAGSFVEERKDIWKAMSNYDRVIKDIGTKLTLLYLEVENQKRLPSNSYKSDNLTTNAKDYYQLKADLLGLSKRMSGLELILNGRSADDKIEDFNKIRSSFRNRLTQLENEVFPLQDSSMISFNDSIRDKTITKEGSVSSRSISPRSIKPTSVSPRKTSTSPYLDNRPSTVQTSYAQHKAANLFCKNEIRKLTAYIEKVWKKDQDRFTEIIDIVRTLNTRVNNIESILNINGDSYYSNKKVDFENSLELPYYVGENYAERPTTSPNISYKENAKGFKKSSPEVYAPTENFTGEDSFISISSETKDIKKNSVKFNSIKDEFDQMYLREPAYPNNYKKDYNGVEKSGPEVYVPDINDRFENYLDEDSLISISSKTNRTKGKDEERKNSSVKKSLNKVDDSLEADELDDMDLSVDEIIEQINIELEIAAKLLGEVETLKSEKKNMITDWIEQFKQSNGRDPSSKDKEAIKHLYVEYKSCSKEKESILKHIKELKEQSDNIN